MTTPRAHEYSQHVAAYWHSRINTFVSVEDTTINASDFGHGSIDIWLNLTKDVVATVNVEIRNNHDRLDIDHISIGDVTDEEEQPVDYTREQIEAATMAAIEEDKLMDKFEAAVFAAQRERATEPDDGH